MRTPRLQGLIGSRLDVWSHSPCRSTLLWRTVVLTYTDARDTRLGCLEVLRAVSRSQVFRMFSYRMVHTNTSKRGWEETTCNVYIRWAAAHTHLQQAHHPPHPHVPASRQGPLLLNLLGLHVPHLAGCLKCE